MDDADGTRLRSGEALADALAAVLEEGPDAVLLNCSRPEAIGEGLGLLAGAGVPFGAYANGFTHAAELEVGGTVEGMGVRTDLGPEAYAAHAMGWVERGAGHRGRLLRGRTRPHRGAARPAPRRRARGRGPGARRR